MLGDCCASPVPLAELPLVASFSLGFLCRGFECQKCYLFLVGSHVPVEFAAELIPQCSLWVSQLQQVEVPSSKSSVDKIVLSVFLGDPTSITSFFC